MDGRGGGQGKANRSTISHGKCASTILEPIIFLISFDRRNVCCSNFKTKRENNVSGLRIITQLLVF